MFMIIGWREESQELLDVTSTNHTKKNVCVKNSRATSEVDAACLQTTVQVLYQSVAIRLCDVRVRDDTT